MEEAQPTNSYINMRGEAIDVIEKTISELGSVFGQLAAMVSEQGFVVSCWIARATVELCFSEMVQRIDANTEDVVDNVQGAQRELMKYWSRVSGNRWLVAKMFGVLMVSPFSRLLTFVKVHHWPIYRRFSSFYGFSLPVKQTQILGRADELASIFWWRGFLTL